jgi:multidrug resistance efflux pump
MRFKRSGFRPYDQDGMISVHLNKPRRRLWRRSRLVLFAIGAALIAGIGFDRAWLRGNGIVAGELTAVAPIVNARLKRFAVHCLDRVVGGQRLAEFENEATVEAATQQLQRLQLGLTQARAQIEIAASEAQAARKLVDAEAALLQQQTAVLKAEDELVKKNYVAVLAWEQAKAAVARADAETRAAEFVYQTKKADQKKAELDAAALQERIASFNASPELTGHFYLTPATDGIVTEYSAQPGDVIPAKEGVTQSRKIRGSLGFVAPLRYKPISGGAGDWDERGRTGNRSGPRSAALGHGGSRQPVAGGPPRAAGLGVCRRSGSE